MKLAEPIKNDFEGRNTSSQNEDMEPEFIQPPMVHRNRKSDTFGQA
jgi:hypothetical protein